MGKIAIGVDVGGTSVKLGMFAKNNGELLKKWEIPTDRTNEGSNVIPDIASSILRTIEQEGTPLSDLVGVGLGVPGPVQPNGFVEVCVNLHWKDRYPARELSVLLEEVPVKIGNDANVAALGEAWRGGGAGAGDAVMITLGTGVGGGVILNHEIVSGRHGLGGEIGHMHVADDVTEKCNCGACGCLEQVASATGIVRVAKRMMAECSDESGMRALGDSLTAKDVCDLGKQGDALADKVLETVARYLGIAVNHLAMTIDPDVFIIGGGVSRAGSYLIDKIRKYYDEFTPISANRGKVVPAGLGNDAGIYGAARLILRPKTI